MVLRMTTRHDDHGSVIQFHDRECGKYDYHQHEKHGLVAVLKSVQIQGTDIPSVYQNVLDFVESVHKAMNWSRGSLFC